MEKHEEGNNCGVFTAIASKEEELPLGNSASVDS
jgi:hypothetical protein